MKKQFVRQPKLPAGAYAKTLDEVVEPYAQKAFGTMKWYNLRENKCPQCSKDFVGNTRIDKTNASDKKMIHACGFQIYESKYRKIVSSQTVRTFETEQDQAEFDPA